MTIAVFIVEGLNPTEVELVGSKGVDTVVPVFAVVSGAEDSSAGSGGPGDTVAERMDAAQIGGCVRFLKCPLPMRTGQSCNEK